MTYIPVHKLASFTKIAIEGTISSYTNIVINFCLCVISPTISKPFNLSWKLIRVNRKENGTRIWISVRTWIEKGLRFDSLVPPSKKQSGE